VDKMLKVLTKINNLIILRGQFVDSATYSQCSLLHGTIRET